MLLTTGALAFDMLDPPKPGAADGWYLTDDTFSMLDPSGDWSDQGSSHYDYVFNDAGLPIRRFEDSINPGGSSRDEYILEYDGQNRLIRSVRSDGNHEMRYDYRDDGSHLLIYTWWSDDESQANARTSVRTYDPQMGWYWYGEWTFEMDAKGMIARRWNDTGEEHVYTTEYDSRNRVSKVTVVSTLDHTSYTDEYTYTDDGWSLREGTRTGYEEFVYNRQDQLIKYIFGYDDEAPPYTYNYDSDGNCIEISNGSRRWVNRYMQPSGKEEPGFKDVTDPKAFYYEPVYWAVENGITKGTDATHFSPNATCTRAQVVAFLWRAAGSPEPASADNPFADVKSGAYYYKAVLWAVENNITNGVDPTHFVPDKGCTRAQVVAFLWRAKHQPQPDSDSSPFKDVSGGYFFKAVLWAVEKGITKGTDATHFSPDKTCTRGQIVTFLYRAYTE